MITKFVYAGSCFEFPKHFIDFLSSLDYDQIEIFFHRNDIEFDAWWDPRVIKYIETNADWGEGRLKGAESINFKIGFAGAIYVLEVDTSIPWRSHLTRKIIHAFAINVQKSQDMVLLNWQILGNNRLM